MEFQLSYFKSYKMMLWKCCTQYASKFGKLSSGHRTGKGQFSFQSQRKAMLKNAQTTTQLHSSHTLGKWSKFSKPGFNSQWTMNFQMFKLDLEKAEEPEIKLPTSTESSKKHLNHKDGSSPHSQRPPTPWCQRRRPQVTGCGVPWSAQNQSTNRSPKRPNTSSQGSSFMIREISSPIIRYSIPTFSNELQTEAPFTALDMCH